MDVTLYPVKPDSVVKKSSVINVALTGVGRGVVSISKEKFHVRVPAEAGFTPKPIIVVVAAAPRAKAKVQFFIFLFLSSVFCV
jgi:hypothetical protein